MSPKRAKERVPNVTKACQGACPLCHQSVPRSVSPMSHEPLRVRVHGMGPQMKTPLVRGKVSNGRGGGTRRAALRASLMASLRSALKAPLAP